MSSAFCFPPDSGLWTVGIWPATLIGAIIVNTIITTAEANSQRGLHRMGDPLIFTTRGSRPGHRHCNA